MRSSRETPIPEFARLFAGGRWIRTIGSASWRAHEVRPDSLPERAGFEPSVPRKGDGFETAFRAGSKAGELDFAAQLAMAGPSVSAGETTAEPAVETVGGPAVETMDEPAW